MAKEEAGEEAPLEATIKALNTAADLITEATRVVIEGITEVEVIKARISSRRIRKIINKRLIER